MKKIYKILLVVAAFLVCAATLVMAGITPSLNLNGLSRYTITAYNISGNNINWTDLNDFPVACPANTYVTAINDSITCSAVTGATSNITANIDMNQYNITNISAIDYALNGTISTFANGCSQIANSTGVYFVC